MENINKGTDWRQFRKSTHLASADLDVLKSKGHNLIFTISHCQEEYDTDVNGKKMDGIFCYFTEQGIKPLKLNSTNMKTIAGFARANGFSREQANVVQNWQGMTIELFVMEGIKFGRDFVDGIRVKAVQPKTQEKPTFTRDMFEKAKQAGATIESISQHYLLTNEIAQEYEQYRTT